MLSHEDHIAVGLPRVRLLTASNAQRWGEHPQHPPQGRSARRRFVLSESSPYVVIKSTPLTIGLCWVFFFVRRHTHRLLWLSAPIYVLATFHFVKVCSMYLLPYAIVLCWVFFYKMVALIHNVGESIPNTPARALSPTQVRAKRT